MSRLVFGCHPLRDLQLTPLQYTMMVVILGILSIGLVKLSVILLYRRIFKISRAFSIYSWFLVILTILWTVAFLATTIFQCGVHPTAAWTSTKTFRKYCGDTSMVTTVRVLTNLLMDLMILAAPMGIIWRMQLSLVRKLQVTGIFALGFL